MSEDVQGPYRARHGPAAPEAYGDPQEVTGEHGYVYGDGLSPYPLHRGDQPTPWPPVPAFEDPAPATGYPDYAPTGAVVAQPEPVPPELAPPEPVAAEPAGAGREPEAGQPAPEAPRTSRAGRNLPAAIGVGLTLGGVVLASLLLWRPAFLLVVAAAAGIAIWEMTGAVAAQPAGAAVGQRSGVAQPAGAADGERSGASAGGEGAEAARPPLLPLLAGCVVMITLAWFDGVEALVLGLTLTVLATMVWRLADGPVGYYHDLLVTTLIAVYVPFLAGFAVLLAKPADGDLRVIVTLAAVVLSDTGGYVAGVFFGRRPMAPSVSPKKSWEGLGGSLVATAAGGAVLMFFVLHRPWWHGVIFGLAVSAAAVLGDLAESLLKRDLGVKDMSNLLPGHGGLMDRLDSILFAAPTAFVLLAVLAPPGM